jgi:hypothetical protein
MPAIVQLRKCACTPHHFTSPSFRARVWLGGGQGAISSAQDI